MTCTWRDGDLDFRPSKAMRGRLHHMDRSPGEEKGEPAKLIEANGRVAPTPSVIAKWIICVNASSTSSESAFSSLVLSLLSSRERPSLQQINLIIVGSVNTREYSTFRQLANSPITFLMKPIGETSKNQLDATLFLNQNMAHLLTLTTHVSPSSR